jgi:hypothetical protein
MKQNRRLLIAAAIILSAMPVFWMGLILFVQFFNVIGLDPPYWREFACAALFWVGFASSLVFARRCFAGDLRAALSPVLMLAIMVGIAGGIAEELILVNNPKTQFPLGFFELAPLSWLVAGVVASLLPNPALNADVPPAGLRPGSGPPVS